MQGIEFESTMKAIFKQALTETLYEQRELLREIFAEVMEEIALTQAITEGSRTEPVGRADIFELLDSGE
uniref:Uncharacterized protein n=1 Tax=Candidatus Kentrum eta TaxID=2126337 RepID=A0A450VG84_9GAMM|nr:MAG: hypothetical protein BECKH772B_GA0070898_101477 [Candidatus Kentron sp. H]VFJ99301.1 MAG: hypothetical protein BECKH772A_GA0070896_101596 [Candidatus Kentron sp. H]VFK03768.1 MAG: hypothetical protein BECKH772C_GA0070978_101447 [Candidatus Kentron sp. H]